MKNSFLGYSLLLLVLVVNNSCDSVFKTIHGEGPIIAKEIQLDDFHEIEVSSGWEIELIPHAQPGLLIETEENLIPMINYQIRNGRLYISHQGSVGRSKSRRIKVFFRQLNFISAQSSAKVFSAAIFEQPGLYIEASSNAQVFLKLWTGFCEINTSTTALVNLEGLNRELKASAHTSSRIEAKNLKTDFCQAVINTKAYMSIHVSDNLTAETDSGGELEFFGNPKTTNLKYNHSDEGIRSNDRIRSSNPKTRGSRAGSRD